MPKMSIAEVLRRLQTVPDPHEIFPSLDTPFSKYSRSNYAASSFESPMIREIISERTAQIKDIDTICQRVEGILEQFRERREQVVSSMKMHEGFVSCIRRLPSDILEEIFSLCLPPEIHKRPDAQAAPLLLAAICRSWRGVALDTPRLWCSLVIKETEQPEQLSYCDSWLKKAKGYPLSLKVQLPPDPVRTNAVLDLLQGYTSRLKSFIIEIDELEEIDGRLLLSDLPILERLCLSGNMYALIQPQTISITQPHPRLRFLTIHSLMFDLQCLYSFNPGWANLTHLALVLDNEQSELREPVLLALLQKCPNLEHLVFLPVFVFLTDNTGSFTHSKLRFLEVADVEWDSSLLHTLTLPNLNHLFIRLSVGLEDAPLYSEDMFIPDHSSLEGNQDRTLTIKCQYSPADDNHDMLTVFNPGWTTLTHLRTDFNATEDFLLHVLELGSNLEDLVVSSIDIDDNDFITPPESIIHPTLRSLTIEIRSGPFDRLLDALTLPGLCHLDLWLLEVDQWPDAGFKAFLARSQCPLESLKIKGYTGRWEEFGSLIPALIPTLMHVEVYELTADPVYSWSR